MSKRALGRANRLLWTYDETIGLISILEDRSILEVLKNKIRNNQVYEMISDKMCEMGFSRTADQCRHKVKNLKSEYKSSGSGDPKKVPIYFPLLEGLFGAEEEGSPSSMTLDESDTSNRVSSSPNDLKRKTSCHIDNYYTEQPSRQRMSSPAELSHQLDFYIDKDCERSSSPVLDLEKDEEDELNNIEWNNAEKKEKPLSSKSQRKIRALKTVMETITRQFMQYQVASENRFYQFERERMRHEAEIEEKRMMFLRDEIARQAREDERREAMTMQVLERILKFCENTSQGYLMSGEET